MKRILMKYNLKKKKKNKLTVILKSDDFINNDIMKIFANRDNLKTGFKEIFKLCCLISTIPTTTVSVESSFSELKRIKIFARSTQSLGRMK